MLRARAEHRVVMKPGLDEEPAKYATFEGGQFDDEEPQRAKLVKRYLGEKKKKEKEEKKLLKKFLQGEENYTQESDDSLFNK